MRFHLIICCTLFLACGRSPQDEDERVRYFGPGPVATTERTDDADDSAIARSDGVPAAGAEATPDVSNGSLPENLGTRTGGSDWTRFLGPTGDSKSSERGILTKWPAEGPRIVWHQRTGVGYGMPTISRGRLFQFARFGDQARLSCQKSETGEPLWKFEYATDYEDMYGYDNGPRCSPVVDGDRVYTFGAEGMLHCVRVADGARLWKVDTKREFGVVQNFFGVGSTPVIEGDLLIVQVGGSPPEDHDVPPGQLDRVHGNGSGVVAFDKLTGKVRYKLSDELASYAGPTLATIDGRRWCFVFARGGLLAFDPNDGKIDFHYPWRATILESVNASNPVVVGDQVFISETYGPGSSLLRVRPGGYEVVWSDLNRRRDKAMQTHWNTPIHHEGYLYGSSGRHEQDAELRCVEMNSGKVMWSEPNLGRTSLVYVDGHFVVLAERGELYLIRATPQKFDRVAAAVLTGDGQGPLPQGEEPPRLLQWPAWAAPILSHGLLYVRGKNRLVCLELIPRKSEG